MKLKFVTTFNWPHCCPLATYWSRVVTSDRNMESLVVTCCSVTVIDPFSHRTGTLWCLQKEMATYRHWSVSLWQDPDDVSHCQILSLDKTEWRLISATLCGWRRCFVAEQLSFMTRIREEEDWFTCTMCMLLHCLGVTRWLSGRASDLRSRSRGFEGRPRRCCVTTLGKLFTPYCLCHQAV